MKYNDCNLEKLLLYELVEKIQDCRTGTTIFTHGHHLTSKIIREGLSSFWNHTAVVFWINNEVYIVEGMRGRTVYPILFTEWVKGRENEIFGVVERYVEDKAITKHFGKDYDLWSVIICFFIYRFTGVWFGRIDDKASRKVFCFELSALVVGLERYWDAVPDKLVNKEENALY